MKKQRKRSTLRKARQAILNTADDFQKSGIDCTHRMIFVGGARPKSVQKTRDENPERFLLPELTTKQEKKEKK